MRRGPFRHLVWDMGGTMVDTYPQVDEMLRGVVVRHGCEIALAEVSRLTRVSIGSATTQLALQFGIERAEFVDAYAALKRRWRTDPPPVTAGCQEVLARVRDLGGLNLVVTHRDRASASSLLLTLDLRVDALICAPDGYARKPSPAMHHAVIGQFGLDVRRCLAVGDRPIDVEAARAAGMAAALLETPGIPMGVKGCLRITALAELLPLLA